MNTDPTVIDICQDGRWRRRGTGGMDLDEIQRNRYGWRTRRGVVRWMRRCDRLHIARARERQTEAAKAAHRDWREEPGSIYREGPA